MRAPAIAAPGPASAAQEELRRSLGFQGVVDVDPLTRTPRVVARLDGYLTGPSSRDAKEVALDYVRARPGVFRLDGDDLAGLRLVRDYTDVHGVRHLHWVQTAGGIAAFDNDLRANVAADGRLINVLGSPLPDLAEHAAALSSSLDAAGALRAALASVGRAPRPLRVVARGRAAERATRFTGGHRARLVFFNRGDELALAWDVTAYADGDEVYATVVDAAGGAILRRANKVDEADGLAWDYFPSTAPGGGAISRDFDAWLANPADTTRLFGPNAHVFSDLNDSNTVTAGEQITARPSGDWNHVFEKVDPAAEANARCESEGAAFTSVCSWDNSARRSWRKNRLQNGTQVFYFVNNFHDHLEEDPNIGFDAASGNFEDSDRVVAHSDDGANTGGGFLGPNMPSAEHVNNANMLTLPDGESPRMQMYLFTWEFDSDPTADANGGDDASVVYHEYTHGLSNRLITYGDGFGALDAHQSGAMGEAWSDWYALDFLEARGFETDGPGAGDVVLGAYLTNGESFIRTQAIDCAPSDSGGNCGSGGYTYGDLGEIAGFPQVHADGEIWGQTLWDLRQHPDVGVAAARALVTEGMRLSPPNPSFLDMRNAILQADTALGGAHAEHIWEVFAGRGMGYFAATTGPNDTAPIENFDEPPAPGLEGTLAGVVRDPQRGNRPVAGVRVRIPGNPGGLSDVTDSLGQYSIPNVPQGTYPLVQATKRLYDGQTAENVTVTHDAVTRRNLVVRRDWSARAGGARVESFTPPDLSPLGCGPRGAIDQSLITGWASDTGRDRQITVKLPVFVDVTHLAVDPGATCADPEDASLRRFRLLVSRNGSTFTEVEAGRFRSSENHKLNVIDVRNRNGIRFVRLTMISSQGNPDFMDMSELSVYGKPRPSCFGAAATVLGNEGDNAVKGTPGSDVFVGLGGNDRFGGGGGDDLVCGGSGNDTLTGGGGSDRIEGGSGNDTVHSKDGRRERTIRGGSGGGDRIRRDASDRVTGFERRF